MSAGARPAEPDTASHGHVQWYLALLWPRRFGTGSARRRADPRGLPRSGDGAGASEAIAARPRGPRRCWGDADQDGRRGKADLSCASHHATRCMACIREGDRGPISDPYSARFNGWDTAGLALQPRWFRRTHNADGLEQSDIRAALP